MQGVDHAALNRAAQNVSMRYRERKGSLAIQSDTEALAYALSRMPATQAAIGHVFDHISIHPPKTILDFGAGPGTATLTARRYWPDAEALLIENNSYMRDLSKKLVPDANIQNNVVKSDLVIAAYALNEMPDAIAAARDLWNATNDTLVLIDTGTPDAYKMMMGVRDALLEQGAHMAAPCPHVKNCPYLNREGWCHFSVRLERTRLHKHLKGGALGYEDEKFTYLVFSRTSMVLEKARIVGYPHIGKVIGLTLCTPDGALVDAQISKRDDHFKQAKKSRWGDLF